MNLIRELKLENRKLREIIEVHNLDSQLPNALRLKYYKECLSTAVNEFNCPEYIRESILKRLNNNE